jgi:hypothetical protein
MADSKGPSKTRLVTDLDKAYKDLNLTLTKTAALSKNISDSLKGISGAGPSTAAQAMASVTPPPMPNYLTPQQIAGGGGGGGDKKPFSYGNAAALMAGAAVNALNSAVDPSNYITNSIATNRFSFYAGMGNANNPRQGPMFGSLSMQSMQNMGTSTSAMDAANAAMSGNSSGLMSGLRNYGTISQSAASVSNIMPGAGLEGGMGAVSALNQGSSVNKLRMIGINVRDQNGFMRDIESIARDLWKNLTTSKNGKGKITAQDLSFSLQSGNSLDMMLNQYFGNDAVLRQSIISYLYQFAQENGMAPAGGYTSDAGKALLKNTGANPSISQSIGDRNAAGYQNTAAFTNAGIQGIESANSIISALSRITAGLSAVAAPLIAATTFTQTLAGAGNGAGGSLIAGFAKTLSNVTDGMKNGASTLLNAAVAPEIAAGILGGGALAGGSALLGVGINAAGDTALSGFDRAQIQDLLKQKGMDASLSEFNFNASSGLGAQSPGAQALQAANPLAGRVGSSIAKDNFSSQGKYKTPSDTSAGWAGKLLDMIGAPRSDNNIKVISTWMQHENTSSSGYMGDRNNPLNLKSTYGQGYSRAKGDAIPIFDTEQGGLVATANQLLSNNNKGDQYYNILQDLLSSADPQTTINAVTASPWAAGNYGGHITINVNGAQDPKAVAKEVATHISVLGQRDMARGK